MRCPRCGFDYVADEEFSSDGETPLRQVIIYPSPILRSPTAAVGPHDSSPPLPEWRIELRERVRAFQARRAVEANNQPINKT
jgi:hypothetical protein